MPTGNLPAEGKKLWERVYDEAKTSSTCKDAGGRKDECAARVAWTAVKNAGWKKDDEGNWHKSSLTEFSLRIEKASYDKATNERRWRAVASDTEEDSREDNMSLELFRDFLKRIDSQELVPEAFRSDFWSGGMPYLSVSHYPDFNGEAVPGNIDSVYIDGSYLKAKGTFHDTPLGRRCFEAVCADLYSPQKSEAPDKVRISIAFLDWSHQHKSSGFIFERTDTEDICPECIREALTGEGEGKVFLRGHLVHLAMTRVPVNKRTDMEVDKSMAEIKTRKDDAASIVGDELAEELESKAKLVGKSETLVIRSEEPVEEAKAVTCPACGEKVVPTAEGTCPKCGEDMGEKGEMEDTQPKASSEAEEEACTGKKKDEEKSETVPVEAHLSQADLDNLASVIRSTLTESINLVVRPVEPQVHPLDGAFTTFKAAFDGLNSIEEGQRLHAVQEPFNQLGQAIVEVIKASVKRPEPIQPVEPISSDLATVLSEAITKALQPVAQKLDMVSVQLQSRSDERIPARRSVSTPPPPSVVTKSETPKLRAIIEKTT